MEQRLAEVPRSRLRTAKVIRIVAEYPVGGKSSFGLQPLYFNLSRVQASIGHDVHVIAKRSPGQPSLENYAGVTVHRVDFPFNLQAIASLRKLVDLGAPTIIHTHSTSGYFLTAAKRTFAAPLVSHVHGTTYSAATPAVLSFGTIRNEYSKWGVTTSFLREKALWSAADRIAAVSTSVQSDLISRYGIDKAKIRLVFNGVDATLFRPDPAPDFPEKKELEGKKVVLYVGHFGLRKGIPFLIRSMKMVSKEVPNAVLVCIGGVPSWLPKGDYWSYLNALIKENDLDGKVLLLDGKANEELPAYYSASDVFVLPSYYEAFPKVLIEAMACEKPVVTCNLGGTRDSVEDGVNGTLVDYANPNQLADAIIAILEDEGMASRMGKAGRERVLRDFTWQAVSERVESVYGEVLTI